MTPPACEVNFDGLIGPTHNYAGLAHGNVASQKHQNTTSHPKQAALQGLAKMKLLADLGLKQAVLPPQQRPDTAFLRRAGFEGSDAAVLQAAHRDAPQLLAAACSASSMWAANAATVCPSPDSGDGRVHFTPANLVSHLHRGLEPTATTAILKEIFHNPDVFAVHAPLPACPQLGDEGAANHTRLCPSHGQPGIQLFVYGKVTADLAAPTPAKYAARHTRQASQAVARLHRLDPARTVFAQQNPAAIDAGVFHNDVIAVGNENTLLYHSQAFVDTPAVIRQLKDVYTQACGGELACIEVTPDQLTLADAVKTYLFNSQLVTLPDGAMALVCPAECRDHPAAKRTLDAVTQADNPITSVQYVDVRQSMQNGGGPACLRLRVVLTQDQIDQTHQGVFLTDTLYAKLTAWVNRHYRDHLDPPDLADPKLLTESHAALDELTNILGLGCLYPFQRERQ